jgi:hypothetical protein
MKFSGRGAISDFLDDHVLYRNLIPCKAGLPGLPELRGPLGIDPAVTPRKTTVDYARVIHAVLTAAQEQRSAAPLARLIYVGDTRMNDGTAFSNIAEVSGLPGMAFIGSEKIGPLSYTKEDLPVGKLYSATRWSALDRFHKSLAKHNFIIDESTAILIDMDKTALGARGRNDGRIDEARLDAARLTAEGILGADYDKTGFQKMYDTLNQPEFHPLTADNQDYLVYVCLTLSGGWINMDDLLEWYYGKEVTSFPQFVGKAEASKDSFPANLRGMHDSFHQSYTSGDPTPFKAFRYSEYLATLARMGQLSDKTLPEEMIQKEIVMSQEVYAAAMQWKAAGALLFGISDKPDEASIPSADQAAQGMRPIHEIETHILGA